MESFVSLVKWFLGCSTVVTVVFLLALSLPASPLSRVLLRVMRYGLMVVAALCVGLWISPVDLLPFLPFDDVAYVLGAGASTLAALAARDREEEESLAERD